MLSIHRSREPESCTCTFCWSHSCYALVCRAPMKTAIKRDFVTHSLLCSFSIHVYCLHLVFFANENVRVHRARDRQPGVKRTKWHLMPPENIPKMKYLKMKFTSLPCNIIIFIFSLAHFMHWDQLKVVFVEFFRSMDVKMSSVEISFEFAIISLTLMAKHNNNKYCDSAQPSLDVTERLALHLHTKRNLSRIQIETTKEIA